MSRLVRLGVALLLALVGCGLGVGVAAASAEQSCAGTLVIFTTTTGTVSQTGQVTHFRDSGVAGQYATGPLAGYSFVGAQDIMINNVTATSELQGEYTASGPGGTISVKYTGHANLLTGAATGHFETHAGTGSLASFHWSGAIAAQQPTVGVPLFNASDAGPCRNAP